MLLRWTTLICAALAIWTLAWGLWTADGLIEKIPYVVDRALRRIPLCIAGAGLALALAFLLAKARRRGQRALLVAVPVGLIGCSLIFAILSEFTFYLFAPHWGPSKPSHLIDNMMMVGWVYLAWSTLFLALTADAERRDRDLQLARSVADALDARHRLLLSQSQPHFLFNALNAIYALILQKNCDEALQAILALSDYLRHSLAVGENLIPLRDELRAARTYLAIEKLRFGDRLVIEEVVEEKLLDVLVPSLIVQPIVENSIKHGLAQRQEPLSLSISAATVEGRCSLNIYDDGDGAQSAPGSGIGLASVLKRLEAAYSERCELVARSRLEGGFEVRISFPLVR